MKRLALLLALLSVVLTGGAQRRDLSGVVFDEDYIPIVGAHLIVKGTSQSAVTDRNGRYVLRNVVKGDTIKVTYAGYDPVEEVIWYSDFSSWPFHLEKSGKQIEIYENYRTFLDWLILHPMGYLPDNLVSATNLERLGTTSNSHGLYVWNNFKKGDHLFSGDLKRGTFFEGPPHPSSIHAYCGYGRTSRRISNWGYIILYDESKTAEKVFKTYLSKELKKRLFVKIKTKSAGWSDTFRTPNGTVEISYTKGNAGGLGIIKINCFDYSRIHCL